MADLVPIRVIIRKGVSAGRNSSIYPNFNVIDPAIRRSIPWSLYIDQLGIGWHYDKIDNIGTGKETGACATCVPKDFAGSIS